MQPRRPDFYLEFALLALRKVPLFIASRSLKDYQADLMCQSAIERQLEIAGDALGQLRKLDPIPARSPRPQGCRLPQRSGAWLRQP
jgi:uncharacterized protein with HEPN domain